MSHKVSIIVPSRNERFLAKTVDDLLAKATGEVQVIAVLDGYWPNPMPKEDKRLILLHRGAAMGMRAANNGAASLADGEFLMKCDAHCMFAEGFDEVLKADCADNWMVVPRRYSLDAENWAILETGKAAIDYHYLSCPIWARREHGDYTMHGVEWRDRGRQRRDKPEYELDETGSIQGSCWFMTRKHWNRLAPMSEEGYGTFAQEPQELGNKTWLGDGRMMVNKKTWYAHLHKGKQYGRGYALGGGEVPKGHEYSAVYWMNNRWPERVHDLEWLIDRFWPMPTWPDDWKAVHAAGFGPTSPQEPALDPQNYYHLGR